MPKSPHLEPPCPAPIRPSGARRLNLDMRARLDQADGFCGLPPGTAKPLRFLAAFQEAEPYLGAAGTRLQAGGVSGQMDAALRLGAP